MPIVQAVATFANSTEKGRRQEAIMQSVVLQAYAEGITDPDVIRQRIQDALTALNGV